MIAEFANYSPIPSFVCVANGLVSKCRIWRLLCEYSANVRRNSHQNISQIVPKLWRSVRRNIPQLLANFSFFATRLRE